jgi:hypothetical protein
MKLTARAGHWFAKQGIAQMVVSGSRAAAYAPIRYADDQLP